MREIKFRALFKDVLKQEYKWFYATVAEKPTIPINYGQHTEWEQFTGRQDSEGIDVYENDVWRRNGFIGLIVFDYAQWSIKPLPASPSTQYPSFWSQVITGKVTGSIHQHAHLLEE